VVPQRWHIYIVDLEPRVGSKDVEQVQSKMTLISNLLEDVRVNLETVGEQKAAERIEQSIKRLRTRKGSNPDEGRQTA
jgi:hypothetical protein